VVEGGERERESVYYVNGSENTGDLEDKQLRLGETWRRTVLFLA